MARGVEGEDRRVGQARRDGLGRVGLGRRGVDAGLGDIGVDAGAARGGEVVGEADILADVVGEVQAAVGEAGQVAEQGDAFGAQGLQADGARHRQGRAAGDAAVGADEGGARHVEEAAGHQPVQDVAAAVAPRGAADPAGGEIDPAAGADELVGELGAGLGGADQEHRALGQRGGVAVGAGVDLGQVRRQGSGEGRAARPRQGAAGGDHGAGADRAVAAWRGGSRRGRGRAR